MATLSPRHFRLPAKEGILFLVTYNLMFFKYGCTLQSVCKLQLAISERLQPLIHDDGCSLLIEEPVGSESERVAPVFVVVVHGVKVHLDRDTLGNGVGPNIHILVM